MSELNVAVDGKTPKWLISRASGAVLRCKNLDELRVRRTIGLILPSILHNAIAQDERDGYLKRVVNGGYHFGMPGHLEDKLRWARKASRVWRIYDGLIVSGKKVSLNKIGKLAGTDYNCVGRILDRLGIGRENVAHRKINLSAEHKDAVDRTLRAYGNLAASDLAYFLRTEKHVIQYRKDNLPEEVSRNESRPRVTGLELTSRVYEREDNSDFSNKAIAVYVGCSARTVERRIAERSVFEPIILGVLGTAYPERELDVKRNVPYLTKEDKFE